MHKGNIAPTEAYQRLKGNASAVLVDVRTQTRKFSASAAPARVHHQQHQRLRMQATPIAGMWRRALKATRMPTVTAAR
jgi:hypothetical protein